MKFKVISLSAFLLLTYFTNAQNDKGWEYLFNGTNLKGWELLNGTAEFRVEDGAIVGFSKANTPNTFLATKKKYGDFILEYEANVDSLLNAGVQIRSNSFPEYKNGRVHGYQVEFDPTRRAWTGGIFEEGVRGWLYNLDCNPKAQEAFKQEEWNKFRVEAIGDNIRVWLNDVPAVDLIDDKTASGFIALQVHGINRNPEYAGRKVKYRNIKIITKNLEEVRTPASADAPQVSYMNNKLTQRETDEGWKLLWDGETTNGWRSAKLDKFPEKGWAIADGTLSVEADNDISAGIGGDIMTDKKYKNFVLEIDFKFTKGANSGIKYFVDPEINAQFDSAIGCEYQILDDARHIDAKQGVNQNRTVGSLFDLIKANAIYHSKDSKVKRVSSKWNRARIVVDGAHVEHYLNGIKVIDYDRGNQMWKELVARSKYKIYPNFGEAEDGHILLQDYGSIVLFKNIKIKELD